MVPGGLEELADEFGIAIALVASVGDGTVEVVERAELESNDLTRQLFGDAEAIAALNRSLDGQLLPQTWSQGKVSCLVCKPDQQTIVGLLFHETKSAVEQYQWEKAVDERVKALWG